MYLSVHYPWLTKGYPLFKILVHISLYFTDDIFTLQGVIGVMNEIISEMDKEQSNFDSLSAQLDAIKDQACAEFKDISTELIKSQNRLALLMSRSMFCFNMVSEVIPLLL